MIYPRFLTELDMLVFFTNLKSYGISGQMYCLISSFLSNRRLQMVLASKSSRNIQLMLEFLKAPFLVLHFFYNTLMTFLMLPVDFDTGKTQLISFDQSNNSGAIDVKKDRSVLEKKSSFKMLGLRFLILLGLGLLNYFYC